MFIWLRLSALFPFTLIQFSDRIDISVFNRYLGIKLFDNLGNFWNLYLCKVLLRSGYRHNRNVMFNCNFYFNLFYMKSDRSSLGGATGCFTSWRMATWPLGTSGPCETSGDSPAICATRFPQRHRSTPHRAFATTCETAPGVLATGPSPATSRPLLHRGWMGSALWTRTCFPWVYMKIMSLIFWKYLGAFKHKRFSFISKFWDFPENPVSVTYSFILEIFTT